MDTKKDKILRLVKKHKWTKQINEENSLKSEIDTVKKRATINIHPKIIKPNIKSF